MKTLKERLSSVTSLACCRAAEVFEWQSPQAMAAAHTNPVVQATWGAYEEVCEYVPVSAVEEASQVFSAFTPFGVD